MTILKLQTGISVIFNELPNYGDFDYKKKKNEFKRVNCEGIYYKMD